MPELKTDVDDFISPERLRAKAEQDSFRLSVTIASYKTLKAHTAFIDINKKDLDCDIAEFTERYAKPAVAAALDMMKSGE